jgi:hypothetical protein
MFATMVDSKSMAASAQPSDNTDWLRSGHKCRTTLDTGGVLALSMNSNFMDAQQQYVRRSAAAATSRLFSGSWKTINDDSLRGQQLYMGPS